MRQREDAGPLLSPQMLTPIEHRGLETGTYLGSEMKALRIGTDRKHEFEMRQPIEQGWMPERGALGSRRKVSAMRVLPGKAEAHGG